MINFKRSVWSDSDCFSGQQGNWIFGVLKAREERSEHAELSLNSFLTSF